MKFTIERRGIYVTPQNDQDVAYIEDTLGLKKEGDSILLVRKNAAMLFKIAYLTTDHVVNTNVQDK